MIKQSILSVLTKAGFVRKKWVNAKILDRNFRVLSNTIRSRPDKDDAWLFALSRQSKVVFDIGSNIGQATMQILYHENIQKIILIDSNPAALSAAAENLVYNHLSMRAMFINAFISDKCDEEIEFYTTGSGAAGSKYRGFAKTAAQQDSHFRTSTLTVDYLSDYFDLVPDLVKIDVEGAEREVLAGAVQLALKGITSFFVEVHSGPELSITDNTMGILEWCTKNNYTAWYLKNKSILTIEEIRNRGRYHALLLPVNVAFPQVLRDINESDPIK